jgi:3-mercaptopyruvate sulfurtransferase SseA
MLIAILVNLRLSNSFNRIGGSCWRWDDKKDYQEAHIPGSMWADYHQPPDMKAANGLSVDILPMPELAK